MSDLQVMLTTNGVLSSVAVAVKTSTGVQIITHYPVAMAQSLPLLAFAQTADATCRELLLRWNFCFRRIHGTSIRSRLRQLFGLTEAEQSPDFTGTHYWKLVTDPISQPLPPQCVRHGQSGTKKMDRGNGRSSWTCLVRLSTPRMWHQTSCPRSTLTFCGGLSHPAAQVPGGLSR